MTKQGSTESQILAEILSSIGSRPDVRLWRNNRGKAREVRTGRLVSFGVDGQADLSGIWLAPVVCKRSGCTKLTGRRLEIEVKAALGRQSEAQRNFQRMIESMGGVYVLARSVEDVLAVIDGDPVGGMRSDGT